MSQMTGIYLHSPNEPCVRDCCGLSPCPNKGEEITYRGQVFKACIHSTLGISAISEAAKSVTVQYRAPATVKKSPYKALPAVHSSDCVRKNTALPCPFGRCEQKFENIFKHFFGKHEYMRTSLNSTFHYRLRNINKDLFLIYEPTKDVFFVGYIEDSYLNDIVFELYVIHNYKKSCCGNPKFVFTIPGIVQNRAVDLYKSKYSIGKSPRKLHILKDKLKKTEGSRIFYDLRLIVKRLDTKK